MGCSTGSIQLLRGSHSDFSQTNPIIDLGEFVYTNDPITFKIGDGVTPWSDLPVAIREICSEPCVKTFRLYSKINYQYAPDTSNLPARSGMPMFDTQIDILPSDSFKITFENTITSAGTDVSPDDIQINGQKSTMVMVNNTVIGSGSFFEGSVEEGGRLVVGVNDDNYEDNQGYYLVKYDDCACATNTCATTVAPTTSAPTTTTTTATPTTTTSPPVQTTTPEPILFQGSDLFDEFGRCVAVSKNGDYLVIGSGRGQRENHIEMMHIYRFINGQYVLDQTITRPGTLSGATSYAYQAVAISDNGILAASISRVHITNPGTPQQVYNNLEPELMIFERDSSAGGVWRSWKQSAFDTPTLLNLPENARSHYDFPYDVQLVISSNGTRLLALQRGLGLIGFELDDTNKSLFGGFNLSKTDFGGGLASVGAVDLTSASIATNRTGSSVLLSTSTGNTNLYTWDGSIFTVDSSWMSAEGRSRGFGASNLEFNADISEDGKYIAVCRKYNNVLLNREERYIYWYRRKDNLNSNGVVISSEWIEIYKEITLNTNQAAPCTDGDYDIGVKLTNNGKSLHVIGVAGGNTICGQGYSAGGYYLNQTMFYDEASGFIVPDVTIHPDGDQQTITIQGTLIRFRQINVDTVNEIPDLLYAPHVCTTEAGTIILGNPYDSTLGNPMTNFAYSDKIGTVRITNFNTTKP
jgi:hypothetical protein